VLGTIALLNLLLWIIARPGGQPTGRYVGEISGAEAVLLLSRARPRDFAAVD
jgi:hypothetical protein